MATCACQEGQVVIFIAVDQCLAQFGRIHAAKQGTRFEALEPMRQGIRTHFGAFGQDIAEDEASLGLPLVVRESV